MVSHLMKAINQLGAIQEEMINVPVVQIKNSSIAMAGFRKNKFYTH